MDLAGFGDIKNTLLILNMPKITCESAIAKRLGRETFDVSFMMFGTVDPTKIDMQVTIVVV